MKKIAMIVTDVALAGEKGLGRMFYLAELFCKNGFQVDLFTSRFQHWLKRFRTQEEMDAIQAASNCNVIFKDEPGYTKNGINFVVNVFLFPRTHHARTGHITTLCANNTGVYITIYGFLANCKNISLGCQNVVNRLSFFDPVVNLLIQQIPLFLR